MGCINLRPFGGKWGAVTGTIQRITDWFRLKETSSTFSAPPAHPESAAQASAQSGFGYLQGWQYATTSSGNLCQCLVPLKAKIVFLYSD